MKRSIAVLFVASSFVSIANVAHAGGLQGQPDSTRAVDYESAPSTLYIPTEAIPLTPADLCSFPQSGADNSGLGCLAGLAEASDYAPPANIDDIVSGVTTALAPYNIRVTSTRPPEYVPYMMVLPSDEVNAEGTSRTCAGARIDCDGPNRNDIGNTSGGTMNCVTPDPVMAALIAVGYMSGLENNDNPDDPMFYPPDFTAPSVEFQEMCSTFVPTLDEKGMSNPAACAGFYHEGYCDDQEDQISSHFELIGVYGAGPVVEDTTPPSIDAIGIEDGIVLPAGSNLPLTATVTDDSGLVFVRWTITNDSPDFLEFDSNGDGSVCKSHNGICEREFAGTGIPYFQVEGGDYGATELAPAGALGGEFLITFEASDLAGNVTETVTATITVEGGSGESGVADTSGGDGNDDNGDGGDGGDESSTGIDGPPDDTAGADDDGGGCSCTTDGDRSGAAFGLLGMMAFGVARRRARR